MTQIDVYTEEKFEDEEDMRERAQDFVHHQRSRSESELVLDELIRVAKQHHEIYPLVVELMRRLIQILQDDSL